MKQIIPFILFIFAFCVLNAQTVDEAIAHNDYLVKDQKKALIMEGHIIDAIVDFQSIDTVELELEAYTEYIEMLLAKYNTMKKFDTEDTFRKAMIELLSSLLAIAKKEYIEIVDIYSIPNENLTDENYARWKELADIIDQKGKQANDLFLEKQQVFADRYGFSLTD